MLAKLSSGDRLPKSGSVLASAAAAFAPAFGGLTGGRPAGLRGSKKPVSRELHTLRELSLTIPERLEAQRAQEEALAREQASRVKADYWSNLLLPNWATEMEKPELRASHRKMWWNGIPPRLRGEVWSKAVGNDLEVTEGTFGVALEKAQKEIKRLGTDAFDGRYAQILENTRSVFPELKMFAAPTTPTANDEQPLHQDLVNVCLAYATYRPDIAHKENGIHHIAEMASSPPATIPIQRASCDRFSTAKDAPISTSPTTSQTQP